MTSAESCHIQRLVLLLAIFLSKSHLAIASYEDNDLSIDYDKAGHETTLTEDDFVLSRSQPELTHKELLERGIEGESDPTLGWRTEGDIAMSRDEMARVQKDHLRGYVGRAALTSFYSKWPDQTVPYAVSASYSKTGRAVIAQAIEEFHNRTCVRFVARDSRSHNSYIFITPIDGCYSTIGRVGGRQNLSLTERCLYKGIIMHELMHATGFFHEQSRGDRDEYVKVDWKNIMNGLHSQFTKYDTSIASLLGEAYDYNSIMHYNPYAFSNNGKKTLIALNEGADRMGQRERFTELDIAKINKHYPCPDTVSVAPSTDPATTQIAPKTKCKDDDWKCPTWKNGGKCKSDKAIRKICQKSCKLCSEDDQQTENSTSTSTTTTTTTTSTTISATSEQSTNTTSSPCKDKTSACSQWKLKSYCNDTTYKYLRVYCPKSCGHCP